MNGRYPSWVKNHSGHPSESESSAISSLSLDSLTVVVQRRQISSATTGETKGGAEAAAVGLVSCIMPQ